MAKKFETPKGTRDFAPEEMRLRTTVFDKIRKTFEHFGFDELDTPAFEYLEVLTLKAGPQAESEIYAFDDKSGRRLGLRFDLTSSTGRFAANHPELKRPIYRYQIGKVWRYDRPAAGRYREFYQADADIIGSYSMNCEVELMLLAESAMQSFGLVDNAFIINHRKILDAQIRLSGIPLEKKGLALRALDKLDKLDMAGVLEEAKKYEIPEDAFKNFLDMMGLDDKNNDHAKEAAEEAIYLQRLETLFKDDEVGLSGVKELTYILSNVSRLGSTMKLKIDPTLARGLDYYTGPIFEAKTKFGDAVLSFAGGGRYDDLIGLYGGQPQGAVGFSFGVERLVELLRQQSKLEGLPKPTMVAAIGEASFPAAQRVARHLRKAGLPIRMALQGNSPSKHIQYAEAVGIDFIVFIGEEEEKNDIFTLKQLSTRLEKKLSLAGLVKTLKSPM